MYDASGYALISALADVRDALKGMATSLRLLGCWNDVTTSVTVNRYQGDRLVIECYVDAMRSDGRGFAWWVEAQWQIEEWKVEASLREDGLAGQETLEEFGPVFVSTATHLGSELREMTASVLRCAPPPISGG
jgi:hypothetical protein